MGEGVPLSEWFRWAFSIVERQQEVLLKEVESAEKDYPRVILAYKLLGMYAGYLEQGGHRTLTWSPMIEGTSLTPDDDRWGGWLEDFCTIAESVKLGPHHDAVVGPVGVVLLRTCDDIRADYDEAAACMGQYLADPPATPAELAEFDQCSADVMKYAEELQEQGCTDCDEVNAAYDEAAACVEKYVDAPPETAAELAEFDQCLDDLIELAQRRIELGCSS
jgi:hypothetical protein